MRWLNLNEQYVLLARRRSTLNGDCDVPTEQISKVSAVACSGKAHIVIENEALGCSVRNAKASQQYKIDPRRFGHRQAQQAIGWNMNNKAWTTRGRA